MSFLSVFRLIVFIGVTLLAAGVVALAAHNTFILETNYQTFYSFAPLALAAGGLTLFTLPVFLIVDAVRTGAWTSMIVVEMVVMTVLWVLWVATASLSSQKLALITPCSSVDNFYLDGLLICQEGVAIEALSFLTWILIFFYTTILLVFTLIASSRGHGVWTGNVKDTNFFAPSVVPPAAQYPPNFVPQPQQFVQYPQYGAQPMYPAYQPGTPIPQMMPQMMPGMPMQQMPGTPMQQPMQQMPGMPGMPMQPPQMGMPMDPMMVPQPTGSPVHPGPYTPPPKGGEV